MQAASTDDLSVAVQLSGTCNAKLVNYNEHIKNCVIEANKKNIQYTDNKVLFFADIPKGALVALGIASLISLGGGSLCGLAAFKESGMILPAVVFTGLGLVGAVITTKKLLKNNSTEPLLVLDENGLMVNGKYKFSWKDLQGVHVETYVVRVAPDAPVTANLYFQDKDKNILFEISDEFKDFQIDSLSCLLTIASYYRSQAHLLPLDTPFCSETIVCLS